MTFCISIKACRLKEILIFRNIRIIFNIDILMIIYNMHFLWFYTVKFTASLNKDGLICTWFIKFIEIKPTFIILSIFVYLAYFPNQVDISHISL